MLAGISKMTFYRVRSFYPQAEESEFVCIARMVYYCWFYLRTFHGCMFTRALFEYGASSPAIREQCSRFKSLLWQFFRDILLQVLKPEPAERVAMMMVMLIDGAIAAQQAESAECREIPPGVTAWSAAKALIYSEGGTL